jgi:1,2-diacylglycerol 3-alpha-glucosyltransferase
MNIAVFTNNFVPFTSGVTSSILSFKMQAEKLGHNVYVFAPDYPQYKDPEKNVYRIRSVESPTVPGFYMPLPFISQIDETFRQLNTDVVHVHHPFLLGETGLRLAREHNLPVVFTHHSLYEKYSHYVPFSSEITLSALKRLVSSFCNECDLVIAPSTYVKQILNRRGVTSDIAVILTGVETGISQKDIRKDYFISENTKILFHAGRIAKEKNLVFLIKSLKEIIERIPDTITFIAGSPTGKDDYLQKLKALIGRYNLSHKIIFTGNLETDLFSFYKHADLFLFTSKSETQGLVLLESMAAGTPVVCVDSPALTDVVRNEFNGYLVPERIQAYSAAVVSILKNKKKLNALSKNAKITAKEFSAQKQTKKLLAKFSDLDPVKKDYSRLRIIKEIFKI